MSGNPWHERLENWSQQTEDARRWDEVDYARVVHSGSFRRLQGKTQILNLGDSDFYRTRLTHSLEVAQIAGGLARQLAHSDPEHPGVSYLPDRTLIQAIGFTHDLGHPPFGHGGEIALNYCMRERAGVGADERGFEGNGQTLRILTKLEKFSKESGANLARRTLLGVLKYPVPFSRLENPDKRPTLAKGPTTLNLIDRKLSVPPKCYLDSETKVVDWILEPLSSADRDAFTAIDNRPEDHERPVHKSFDCSIMDLADDIAYGVHDLEDAVALRLIDESRFRYSANETVCSAYLDSLAEKYKGNSSNNIYEDFVGMLFGDGRSRKHAISRLVNYFMLSCSIDTVEILDEPLIRYRAVLSEQAKEFLGALKDIVVQSVIRTPEVQHLEFKGQHMVVSVFESLETEPAAFLPRDTLDIYNASSTPLRVICDHVSGMTDAYLSRTYERLFGPRVGSVFDKL